MLELKLLGTPQILLNGRPVSGLAAVKSRALLFYLAVNGRPQSRLVLAGLLWPDKREADALANLRQALYHLRNALPDYLEINRLTIGLTSTLPREVEALLFETESGESNPLAVRQQAVDRYTGEFRAGFYVDEAELFEAWAVVIRERLHHLATAALQQLVMRFTEQQDSRQGLRYSNQWLALEPWREEAHRAQIQLLAGDGQIQAALAHYERCRQLLAAELGAAPSAATVALVEQIRQGAFPAAPPKEMRNGNQQGEPFAIALPKLPHKEALGTTEPAHEKPKLVLRATNAAQSQPQVDWGEAPAPTAFYGRQRECAQVAQWLGQDHCRLVMILGLGGMGKTALAVQVAHGIAHHFDVVIWRSLLNAPPLTALLPGWLHSLAPEQLTGVPTTLDAQLALLFDYLRQRRCLLILDNGESILQTDTQAGIYRAGYEGYGQLLRRMATSDHQSTLLLTSREQPQGIELLPRNPPLVQVLRLTGLEAHSGQALLQSCGLPSITAEAEQMISRYSGNPLALQIVAQVVVDLFDGDLTAFLSQEAVIFDDIRAVLDQQWARLTLLERDLLFWLAIEREPVGIEALRTNLVGGSSNSALVEALRSLQRRSLLEQQGTTFALQNVVTEYLTDRLLDTVTDELVCGEWRYFHSHALIRTQAKEYVRESQIRIMLAPLAARLVQQMGRNDLARSLHAGLAAQRQHSPRQPGYAGGNVLNLLIHLGYDLRG